VAEAGSEIIDPAGRSAGFHDDKIALVLFEEGRKVVSVGGGVEKGMFTGF